MTAPPRLPERYRILETLRDDASEFLARATDTVLHREVLLKAPGPGLLRHLSSVKEVQSVLREARALAKLKHENVIQLLDVVDAAGIPVLVLDPVAGERLADQLATSPRLPVSSVVKIGKGIASALAAVHAAGAVHRGIAPENILLTPSGEPVLVGFGFTKFVTATGFASSIVYTGSVDEAATSDPALPLPRYPAPEQWLGQAADARSDLFSLGCSLYLALTGVEAFVTSGTDGWKAPVPPNRVVKEIPQALSDAILRCLARSPMQRFQTARDFESALVAASGDATAPTTPVEHAPSPARAHAPRRLPWIAASLLGAALAVAAWMHRTPEAGSAGDTLRSHRLEGGDTTASTTGSIYSAKYDKSYALLIGIGDAYGASQQFPVLPNAERDARAVAAELQRMSWEGWIVSEVIGAAATRERLLAEIANLEDITKPDDRVLLYFAGHGERHPDESKTGWIVPVDGRARKTAQDANTLISYDDINARIRAFKAKHVLLMLDCCFSGKMAKFRSGGNVVGNAMLTSKAHLVITSGRSNERVPDGERDHSPFLEAFVKALHGDEPALTATGGLFARLQQNALESNGPGPLCNYLENGGDGDFVFYLRPKEK